MDVLKRRKEKKASMLISSHLDWLSRRTNLQSVAEIVSTVEHPVTVETILAGMAHLAVLPEPVLARLLVLSRHLLFLASGGYDPRFWLEDAQPLLEGREVIDLETTLILMVEAAVFKPTSPSDVVQAAS